MSAYLSFIRKELRINLRSLRDDIVKRRDRDYFRPSGTQMYCGKQGSGKTLSAVYHVIKIKERYPKCIVASNLHLSFLTPKTFHSKEELTEVMRSLDRETEYVLFSSMDEMSLALTQVNNGEFGVVLLIDEIHTYLNSVAEGGSKNVPMYIFTEISQQRKQHKCIVGTSQLFSRMSKPLREQCQNLIYCSTFANFITKQVVYDGMSMMQNYDGSLSGDVKRKGFFYHTPQLRESYDTFQKVVSGSDQFENIQMPEMVKNRFGQLKPRIQ